jgi:hypothetical protein
MAQTQINGGTQIRAGSITSDRLAAGTIDKTAVGLGNVDNTSDANKPVSTATQTALDTKQSTSAKGVANGYASLDSGGKVPVAQLPNSIMEYQGTFNASSNTPTLANGTGSPGDVYRVSVAGTALGLELAVGDYVIYNGSTWEKSDTTDAVASVAGRTGVVTLTVSDLSDFGTGVAGKFVTRETPTGAINGTNTSFVLSTAPVVGSESVFLNGILQEPGSGNDYTISGSTITYLTAPVTGDRVRVSYVK